MAYKFSDKESLMVCVNCKDCKMKDGKLYCDNMYSDFYKDKVDSDFWCDESTSKNII
jgi:hypothetical protein